MNELQLFVLLQDTVAHIRTGKHIAPNYHGCKQKVLGSFGIKKASSVTLLALIGHMYMSVLEDRETFEEYVLKHDLVETYNIELERLVSKYEV